MAQPSEAPTPPVSAPLPIVGLTLESTSQGTGGPAFAVGATLLGETGRTASDPTRVDPVVAPTPAAPPTSRNRSARALPKVGVHVEAASRLSRVEPTYPALLKAQGREGDVTVRVELDVEGRVVTVSIVRPAQDRAFDDSALAAARSERFTPETHDGRPVPTSITYTYRFRITP